jgi:threonine dehydrogenase-like Zn-dependent dehydrogenase
MSVLSIRVDGPNDYRLDRRAAVAPGDGEVLVTLDSAGICGGDLSHLRGRNAVATYPTVLGHECAARVSRVGAGATLAVGQPVMVYPTTGCGRCRACRRGRYNNCRNIRVFGLSDPRGCFSEQFVVPESQCVPMSEAVLDRYGALVEPLAVGVHVVGRGGASDGETALVIGTGAIGLATTLVATSRGVRVLGVDRYPEREDRARACGATDFTTASGAELETWVRERADAVDLVYDTVCSTETVLLAQRLLAPGGRLVTIASAKPDHQLPLDYSAFYARELSVVSSRNYVRQDFIDAVQLLSSGAVDARPLHTATFALDDFARAIDALENNGREHVKVLLTPRELLGTRELLS